VAAPLWADKAIAALVAGDLVGRQPPFLQQFAASYIRREIPVRLPAAAATLAGMDDRITDQPPEPDPWDDNSPWERQDGFRLDGEPHRGGLLHFLGVTAAVVGGIGLFVNCVIAVASVVPRKGLPLGIRRPWWPVLLDWSSGPDRGGTGTPRPQ